MPNVHINISIATVSFISEIAAALTAKYGAGVTIHYQSATDLVFSCAAISSKVHRINYATDMDLNIYYGDAWTSGTTITNSVNWGTTNSNNTNQYTEHHLILGDRFLLLANSNSNNGGGVYIIALLDNGDSAVFCYLGTNQATAKSYDITKAVSITIRCFDRAFVGAAGAIYKMPLIIVKHPVGEAILNADGSLTGIAGLSISSTNVSGSSVLALSNALITPCSLFTNNENLTVLKTGLIAEF